MYRDITKYRLTTCSTIGHTHKHFVGIKQCLKHNQQLVQTTTILDFSLKRTFLTYWSRRSTKRLSDSCDPNNTHQLTNIASAVNEIDIWYSFLTRSLPNEHC